MNVDEQHVSVGSNLFLTHGRLESLPNELLFMSMAHLSSSDLVQAFYRLNHRFDLIVCQLVRHFTISKNPLEIVFDPDIINVIEKICFDAELLPQIFLSTHSYSNIRSVVLSCSNFATVDLIVDCDSAKNATDSCLDLLKVCTILPTDFDNEHSFSHKKDRSRFEETLNGLVCPAIVRLSINSCSEQSLLSLCAVTPNLTYLKVKQLISTDDHTTCNSILTLIPQLSSLKQLHIAATTNRLNDIHWVGRLIGCYQSSLERLTLEISLNNRVDGHHLQRILEPCQNLRRFTFAFNYLYEETEEIDVLHQFQTDWWLDSHRPTVLVFCGNHRETLVVSMPCYLDDYLWFPVDPKDWLINKGQLNSPNICFTKQKCIRFVNNYRRLITLDLVQIIGHVFRALKQELSIPHWGFISPDLLIEQLFKNTRSKAPVLPLISSLDLNSCNLDQLDAKTLIIWLLLAANVRVLNVCQGTTSAKIQLINRLKALLEEDKRLKSITNSIEEVHVFYMFDSLNYATKQHICQMYASVFRKPVIRR